MADAVNAWAHRAVWKPAGPPAREPQMASATSSGSMRMLLGPQNGVCVKCITREIRTLLAQHRGHEREVVVVDEHDLVLGCASAAIAAGELRVDG